MRAIWVAVVVQCLRDHEFVHVQAAKVGELDYTRRNSTGDLVPIHHAEWREVKVAQQSTNQLS